MKANELRIGNWLRSAESFKQEHREPFYFQVSAEDIVSIWEGHSYAQPIPLTTEILGMAEFKDEDRYWSHNVEYFNICQGYNDGKWYLSVGPGEYSEGSGIQYVHELQNLYFALTATELEINLNKEK